MRSVILGVLVAGIVNYGQIMAGPCGIDDASYRGEGRWADFADGTGVYQVETAIANGKIISTWICT